MASPDQFVLQPLERRFHKMKLFVTLPDGVLAFVTGFPFLPEIKVHAQLHTPEMYNCEILLDIENLSQTEQITIEEGFVIGELILSNPYDHITVVQYERLW